MLVYWRVNGPSRSYHFSWGNSFSVSHPPFSLPERKQSSQGMNLINRSESVVNFCLPNDRKMTEIRTCLLGLVKTSALELGFPVSLLLRSLLSLLWIL